MSRLDLSWGCTVSDLSRCITTFYPSYVPIYGRNKIPGLYPLKRPPWPLPSDLLHKVTFEPWGAKSSWEDLGMRRRGDGASISTGNENGPHCEGLMISWTVMSTHRDFQFNLSWSLVFFPLWINQQELRAIVNSHGAESSTSRTCHLQVLAENSGLQPKVCSISPKCKGQHCANGPELNTLCSTY